MHIQSIFWHSPCPGAAQRAHPLHRCTSGCRGCSGSPQTAPCAPLPEYWARVPDPVRIQLHQESGMQYLFRVNPHNAPPPPYSHRISFGHSSPCNYRLKTHTWETHILRTPCSTVALSLACSVVNSFQGPGILPCKMTVSTSTGSRLKHATWESLSLDI